MAEDEKKEPEQTPEQVAADLAELKSLKERFGKVSVTVKGKPLALNLLDKADFDKAQQYLAGGATFAQDRAAFNAEKEAFQKSKAEAEAEVKKQLELAGKPAGSGAVSKKFSEVLKEHPELKRKLEDGDPTFVDDLGTVLDSAIPESPKSESQPSGVSEERLQKAQQETEQRVLFETRVRRNPNFVALAKHLAEVNGMSIVEAETLIVSKMAGIDPEGMTADAVILDKVVKPWSERLGLKSATPPAERDESGRFKETAPDGSQQHGAGTGAEVAPKFKTPGELDAWMEKRKLERTKTGKWSGDW